MSNSVTEKAKTALREIGLTEYEIRAYICLLQTGVAPANVLSENSDIPYSKIYEVLNSLEKKGWVENQDGRPRLYYPKSPGEALEAARMHIENMMETWRKSVIDELQPLYEKREIREKPDVWIFRGEFDAFAKLKEMVEKAEKEVMIAAPALAGQLMTASTPLLKRLSERGVKLLIMLSDDLEPQFRDLSGLGEVRIRDEMFGGGVVPDGREALLIIGEEKPLIIWSDHLGLVKFAKDYFQHLWNTAKSI